MLTDAERKTYQEDLMREVAEMKRCGELYRTFLAKAQEMRVKEAAEVEQRYKERMVRAEYSIAELQAAQDRYLKILDKIQAKEREDESNRKKS